MFEFFKSTPYDDPQLGQLRRTGGAWRGTIDLGGTSIALVVDGSRKTPDAAALRIARTIASDLPGWRPQIAQALFEHYQPYAESVAAGEEQPPADGMPKIDRPDEVWPHVAIQYVSVKPLQGVPIVEIGLSAAWDEEHTLGARLRDGKLLELNGSVLAP
ncbi:MAG TPA: hypothetical protein VJ890_10205 [Vineibacter sp.]|nr:hypothetical protein [Vineibacter sp.]